MKTAELTGARLDYWVARAEGYRADELDIVTIVQSPGYVITGDGEYARHTNRSRKMGSYSAGILPFSSQWQYCGPLIEKYRMDTEAPEFVGRPWVASLYVPSKGCRYFCEGSTPRVAICRAVVRSAFGDGVPEV